jgi:hypothetical protein
MAVMGRSPLASHCLRALLFYSFQGQILGPAYAPCVDDNDVSSFALLDRREITNAATDVRIRVQTIKQYVDKVVTVSPRLDEINHAVLSLIDDV